MLSQFGGVFELPPSQRPKTCEIGPVNISTANLSVKVCYKFKADECLVHCRTMTGKEKVLIRAETQTVARVMLFCCDNVPPHRFIWHSPIDFLFF